MENFHLSVYMELLGCFLRSSSLHTAAMMVQFYKATYTVRETSEIQTKTVRLSATCSVGNEKLISQI